MNSLMKKAGLGVALAATALTVAAPADAQRYRGHRGHDSTGPAIVAGIAGLAIGAAIASDHSRDRYRDDYYRQRGYAPNYDDGYYRSHGYYPTNGYYAYDYQQRGYSGCYIERRYDRWAHRNVRVRVCR
ncbi:MAG: hypothetical protein JWN66_3972 [Sphingomonas bacterium]|uniref:hypothetical protein n=1 Tax=Sphingomonas bacterium TaxID=1895847 RepID=UPI0026032A38|nr:hypothetical protein [Sphingomonas bacterium]MDB5706856.1 hypothetical protein [Sphingomonas bacterium]